MPGLVKSYNALCGMRRAWAVKPGRSRVLDRITNIIHITDPNTNLLLYLVANKCLTLARYKLGDFDASMAIITKLLHIVKPEHLTCPKIKVENNALNILQKLLKQKLLLNKLICVIQIIHAFCIFYNDIPILFYNNIMMIYN